MKIETIQPEFDPISITIESADELRKFKLLVERGLLHIDLQDTREMVERDKRLLNDTTHLGIRFMKL